MEGALRVQDIIGLILAILIVAILISIILILRESARERKMWKDDYEDFEEGKSHRKKLAPEKILPTKRSRIPAPPVPASEEGPASEIEAKRKWGRIPREREVPRRQAPRETSNDDEVVVEKISPRPAVKAPIPPVIEKPPVFERKQPVEADPEETVEKIPLEQHRMSREPRQAVLERGLKKITEAGLGVKNLNIVLDENNIEFSPLLWEARDEVQSGKAIGDIVIHTAFKGLPGHSGEEVVEMYRSGDVSVVDKLEARVRTAEGRDYVVAVLHLSHFHPPDLLKMFRNGALSEEEFELLNALKFVERSTKKDFARVVYSRITSE